MKQPGSSVWSLSRNVPGDGSEIALSPGTAKALPAPSASTPVTAVLTTSAERCPAQARRPSRGLRLLVDAANAPPLSNVLASLLDAPIWRASASRSGGGLGNDPSGGPNPSVRLRGVPPVWVGADCPGRVDSGDRRRGRLARAVDETARSLDTVVHAEPLVDHPQVELHR